MGIKLSEYEYKVIKLDCSIKSCFGFPSHLFITSKGQAILCETHVAETRAKLERSNIKEVKS